MRMGAAIAGASCRHERGRNRRTSTNSTVLNVSIENWVSARSGAPLATYRPAIA